MNKNIELISIHIPKCGGTNFRNILNMHYRNVPDLKNLKALDNCIHGHFPITPELLKEYSNAKICTWIRHPIDRIISYYYDWKFNKQSFRKEKITLIEFVEADFVQNNMFKWIDQISLDDFDFIGCLEEYEKDVVKFLGLMGWKTTYDYDYKRNIVEDHKHSIINQFGINEDDINLLEVISKKSNVNSKKRLEEVTEKEYSYLYRLLESDIEKYNYIRVNYCGHDRDARYDHYKPAPLSIFSKIKRLFLS